MPDIEHYCTVCGDTWSDHYDAVAHVYNAHDTCGMPPELSVEWRHVE